MEIRILNIENKESYNVQFSGNGTELKAKCPICSHNRKKNKDKVLSYNKNKGTAFCHHCNASFVKFKPLRLDKKVYKRPEWHNLTTLPDNIVKYFEGRKISQNILKKLKITVGKEWMPQFEKEVDTLQFNYFLENELINIKYRGKNKSFKLFKDAELILYNIDSLKNSKECIIVEGEFDCLSFLQVGFNSVVSVPAGANSNTSYLDNYLHYFEDKEIIYLATDNDIKGIELRNELSRRFGKEKCKIVSFEDCKDANEYHKKYGGERLRQCIDNSKEYPITGLFNIKDFESDYYKLFQEGLQKGLTIGGEIDNFISFEKGRLYTITGIPNHGKSNWLDFVIAKLSIKYGLKFTYFSPENHPLQLHTATLTEKFIGSKFDNNKTETYKIDEAFDFLKNNFWFIKPDKDFTIDNILQISKDSIKKYGVNGIIIDPYNKIEHQYDRNTTETNYISRLLDKLTIFAKENDILLFLVAHPKKMAKINGVYEVPSLYDINGSANFYNKTDFGVTVYRNFDTGIVDIYIQKAKFKHLGTVGYVSQRYNVNNGRYSDMNDFEPDFDNSNWLIQNEFEEIEDLPESDEF